ncbi:copper chaperone [Nowakowskiella sp. JEL0078]|nr:copper chaperone [Nowakowskiella sp. JEL0078]
MYRAEFAVSMHCDDCADSVRKSLANLEKSDSHSLSVLSVSVPDQSIVIQTSLPPSLVLTTLRSTGLSSVFRGCAPIVDVESLVPNVASAQPTVTSAAWAQNDNRGLARLVQISESKFLLDVSVTLSKPRASNKFTVSVHEYGDISNGAESTGDKIRDLGQLDLAEDAGLVTEVEGKVWDFIGRSLVVREAGDSLGNAICGIIARSAGLFENNKRVCSCSGKTLWEESVGSSKL